MRTLAELRDVPDPAWPELRSVLIETTSAPVILPPDPAVAADTLVRLQVTAASWLGGMALHTGGVIAQNGWIRLLGGGSNALNLAAVNGLAAAERGSPPFLVVAVDVLGSRWAINGGGLAAPAGEVCSLPVDTLRWEPTGMRYAEFLEWSLSAAYLEYDAHLRWPDWPAEVASLPPDRGISVLPYPFTVEGKDPDRWSRRSVPISELLDLWDRFAAELLVVPDGARVRIDVREER